MAAKIFTLAHELAHLWIGVTGVNNLEDSYAVKERNESFCNQVAAETLVPMRDFRGTWNQDAPVETEFSRLARLFRVTS